MRHSVLNAEAFTAIAFLIILLIRIRLRRVRPSQGERLDIQVSGRVLGALAAAIVLLAFLPAFTMPLLHDSYGHVYTASRESLQTVLSSFTAHPRHGDFFFRPLGYLSFWLDGKWAGYSPFRWHAWSVCLHIVNTVLVFALARQLSLGKAAALFAALFFGLHGSRPEAVAWVAARFDLLAACFVLLTLLSALRYCESGRRGWLAAVAACTTAALLSKESAYCLPLLAPAILLLAGKNVRLLPPSATILLNSVLVLAYRTFILRGIGGYGAERGAPAILQFSPLRTLNALFFRQWALLFFPVNWSVSPGLVLGIALAAAVAALLATLVLAQGSPSRLWLAISVVLIAALPVQHLLLIGSDLSGVRVLYLPVFGLALFWALLLQELPNRPSRWAIAAGLLLFQFAALEHNLRAWTAAARLAKQSCAFLANEIAQDSSPVAVIDLPATWHGVYFLNNSFAACVFLNSAGKLQEMPAVTSDPATAKHVYRWADSRFLKMR